MVYAKIKELEEFKRRMEQNPVIIAIYKKCIDALCETGMHKMDAEDDLSEMFREIFSEAKITYLKCKKEREK